MVVSVNFCYQVVPICATRLVVEDPFAFLNDCYVVFFKIMLVDF